MRCSGCAIRRVEGGIWLAHKVIGMTAPAPPEPWDLANLLQGFFGGLVGALAAGVIAVYTVRAMREGDRLAAREHRREESAQDVLEKLKLMQSAVVRFRMAREHWTDQVQQIGMWEKWVQEPTNEFYNAVTQQSHALKGPLGDHALITSALAITADFGVVGEGRLPTTDELGRVQKQASSLAALLEHYLDSPVKTLRSLERQAKWRSRFVNLRTRKAALGVLVVLVLLYVAI